VVAKAPLAEAQKTAPERPAEPATRAEASSARQRLRALLDGLLWALLLATVALWGVTAVVSKRRH
jgi:flagellar biogenesis protein FliO